jgi:hypothetical protein
MAYSCTAIKARPRLRISCGPYRLFLPPALNMAQIIARCYHCNMKLFLGIVILCVLSIPSLFFGLRAEWTTVDHPTAYKSLGATAPNTYIKPCSPPNPACDVTVNTYRVSCGNAIFPHTPTYSLESSQVIHNTRINTDSIRRPIIDPVSTSAFCHSQWVAHIWETIAWSPIGLALIILIIALFIGALTSGGEEIWIIRIWR